MEQYLLALGVEENRAQKLVAPLKQLHFLRTKQRGHAAGKKAEEIRQQILSDYGSYKNHFEVLCGECDESLQTISEILSDRTDE